MNNIKERIRYGLGEVALIFLGVTIAIWFNNWNENRRIEIKAKNQYIELKNDLDEDLNFIRLMISNLDSKIGSVQDIITHSQNGSNADLIYGIARDKLNGLPFFKPTGYDVASFSLKYDLSLIENKSIIHSIIKFYSALEIIEGNNKSLLEYLNKHITPIYINTVDITAKQVIKQKVFYSVEFRNVYEGLRLSLQNNLNICKEAEREVRNAIGNIPPQVQAKKRSKTDLKLDS